jgi:DNA-directed RNA polymerase specialized sigma24 family protein
MHARKQRREEQRRMNEVDLLSDIGAKLDKLIALFAVQGKPEDKQASIVKSLGFTYKEISDLTGIPEGTLKFRDHAKRKKNT